MMLVYQMACSNSCCSAPAVLERTVTVMLVYKMACSNSCCSAPAVLEHVVAQYVYIGLAETVYMKTIYDRMCGNHGKNTVCKHHLTFAMIYGSGQFNV